MLFGHFDFGQFVILGHFVILGISTYNHILAQYDPPGQVMAFMGVIMILINIISRKNIYQNKLLMRYLKIVELDITRNQPNTGFLKEILELFYEMIFFIARELQSTKIF